MPRFIPWEASKLPTLIGKKWIVTDSVGNLIFESDEDWTEDEATARLIAAAPETAKERDDLKAKLTIKEAYALALEKQTEDLKQTVFGLQAEIKAEKNIKNKLLEACVWATAFGKNGPVHDKMILDKLNNSINLTK